MNSNNQQLITNYFETNEKKQPTILTQTNKNGQKSSLCNTQLNTLYRNNSTERRDHRKTPQIVLNFIQHLKETEGYNKQIRDRSFVDICPYKCTRDNLDHSLWPKNTLLFCNPPWSGSNVEKWMQELVKFVERKKGSAALLTKIDGSCNHYWFNLIYNNDRIDMIKYVLKNNFAYSGYNIKSKQLKRAPFGSVLVFIQPKQESVSKKCTYYQDVCDWKESISSNKYNELECRQQQHRNMESSNDFRHLHNINDDEDVKMISIEKNHNKNTRPNTITQIYSNQQDDGLSKQKHGNHNLNDDQD